MPRVSALAGCDNTDIISMMDVKVQHEDPSIQTSPLITVLVTISDVENEVKTLRNINHSSAIRIAIKSEVPIVVKEYLGTNVTDVLQQQPKPQKSDADIHKIKMEQAGEQQEPKNTIDEDAMDKGVAEKLKKRKPDDTDIDEGPLAGPNQGLKRKKTCKETEPSKKAKSTGTSKGTTKSQPKSTSKSAQVEETVFEAGDTQVPQDLGEDTGNTNEPPVVNVDPKDWFKKPKRPPTPDPEWNEGKSVENKPTQKWICDLAKAEKPSKTFDDLMSTPIDFSAFVMNRLQISDLTQDILVGPAYKLLKGTCRSYVELDYNMEECYKELTDQLNWNNPEEIEDMVPNLWSPIKVAYDKHALLGTSHWGPKRQRFYGYAFNRVSKHDVYSTKRILAVTNVKVNVWYGYGHLEEIEVRRSDQNLYKFKEGDFPRLHLNDIEDMLLLVVQNRLFNLEGDVIVHFAVALRVIYEDKLNRKRLMRFDELYKFSDDTLQSVRDIIYDMATNLRMGYNKAMPKRIWTHLDKTRSHIMVKEIDRQLQERRLTRSLEKFVGGRHYGEDLRLLQRTI
ncbi:hypothetical protein Tco_1492925 [Tanacetum coccineum]